MRRHNNIFRTIKYYAVEIAGTTVFLAWLAGGVWHELEFLSKYNLEPCVQVVRTTSIPLLVELHR